MVFSIVILLNAAAFFFLTTHGESLQLSYLMPFLTENAKEAVGEVVGFIPPHVTLNSAALWVACKRPEETSALNIIKASVHNACPGVIEKKNKKEGAQYKNANRKRKQKKREN